MTITIMACLKCRVAIPSVSGTLELCGNCGEATTEVAVEKITYSNEGKCFFCGGWKLGSGPCDQTCHDPEIGMMFNPVWLPRLRYIWADRRRRVAARQVRGGA